MLVTTELKRVFRFTEKEAEIILTDPEPQWSVEAVLNFYAATYPVLTTAKITGPEINNDELRYQFDSVMGTKG